MREDEWDEIREDELSNDFYTDQEIDVLAEDDEISAAEEGFMRGYLEEDQDQT